MIEAIRASGGVTPATALTVAETLVAYGVYGRPMAGHQGAHEAVEGSGEHIALLRTRYRIRVDLGLPEDELDALLDASALSDAADGRMGLARRRG